MTTSINYYKAKLEEKIQPRHKKEIENDGKINAAVIEAAINQNMLIIKT